METIIYEENERKCRIKIGKVLNANTHTPPTQPLFFNYKKYTSTIFRFHK